VASAYGQIIFVTQNIAQLILYYIEDSITELNINTATRANSVYGIAALSGHNPTRSIAATGEISVSTTNPSSTSVPGGVVIVPNQTRLSSGNNGLQYILDLPSDSIRLSSNGSTDGTVMNIMQGTIETQVFTGTGTNIQSYNCATQQSSQVDNFYVNVYVNGELWTKYDSIYDISRNGLGYIVRTGITSGITVYFGNTNFGMVPPLGSTITIEYLVTSGQTGNINLVDTEIATYTWVDTGLDIYGNDVDLNQIFSINSVYTPDFGANPEPLALTRLIAPKTSRSYVLATTDSYVIFFEKFNIFSIVSAYTTPPANNIQDDNVVYVFLVIDVRKTMTSNENYFTLAESRFVLSSDQEAKIYNLIAESGQQIVTTVVSIINPNVTRYVINIAIILLQGYDENTVSQMILSRLSDYFIEVRRRDRIPRSDLITILESIDGIDTLNISMLSEVDELAYIAYQSLTAAQQALVSPPAPVGLDEFGDIIIQPTDLPLIRGGWTDRNGITYETGINPAKPSAVNIIVRETIPVSYNTGYNQTVVQSISGAQSAATAQSASQQNNS
jgi:hypothetical protein